MSHSNPQVSQAEQAAQAIIDLINSKPQSPTEAEIVAIIAKAAMPPRDVGTPKFRADAMSPALAQSCDLQCRTDELPFESEGADGKPIFWQVEATGDWIADGDVGEEYARVFVERIRAHQPRPSLGWIVSDMVRAGPAKWSGVEVGFLSYMERATARRFMTLLG